MIIGQLLLVMNNAAYYGPTMARKTTNAIFTVEVSNFVGALCVLSVAVEHRNQDDTSWSTAGTFSAIDADATASSTISGLKELIRFKYTFGAGSATDGAYVIAAAPQWLND